MQESNPKPASPSQPPPRTAPGEPEDVYAAIVALAGSTSSKHTFFGKVLRSLARSFASPYAAIHARYASEVFQDDWHTGSTDPKFWKSSLQRFLTESLSERVARAHVLESVSGKTRVAFLSAPIFDTSGSTIGAFALVIAPIDDRDVPTRLATLEALVRLASYLADHLGSPGGATSGRSAAGGAGGSGAAWAQALARAASCSTTEELAFAITNELRNKMDCEQVALGMIDRNRVRVLSISGLDEVKKQSPGVATLRAAMEECLDADAAIVEQPDGRWEGAETRTGYRLHKQWYVAAKGDAVASMPLRVGEKASAILSMRRRANQPFTQAFLDDVRTRVEPFAAALHLTRRADRSVVRHAADSVRSVIGVWTGRGRWPAKFGVALFAAALGWFVFGTIEYHLSVPAVVTPTHVRHVSAPFDGVLQSAAVMQGDYVHKNDVLCALEARDLEQQRRELLAELAVLEREEDRALATDAPAEVQLARANFHLAETKLDIIERRIERTTLRAPFDGVIVRGDLRKRIGSTLARGDPLFELAPIDEWTLELEVPEHAAADVTAGLTGVFASYARPDQKQTVEIAHVDAAAQVRDQHNVFIAEASLGRAKDWLRPGMEGVAKLRVGRRAVWWVALHRVTDYLRMTFWL